MMPRGSSEAMEGGYSHPQYAYGRQAGSARSNSMGGGSHAGANVAATAAAMGLSQGAAFDGATAEMRQRAAFGMGGMSSAAASHHHHGMGGGLASGMDPTSGFAMNPHHPSGFHSMRGSATEAMGLTQSPGGTTMGGGLMGHMGQAQGGGGGFPYGQDVSPNMPRMSTGSMYSQMMSQQQQQQQQQQLASQQGPSMAGNSPHYTGAGQDRAGQVGAGAAASNSELGTSESRSSGGGGGPAGSTGGASGLSQAEREEELLLNLLIARRQRGRMSGEPGGGGPGGPRQDGYYADELLRLRQGRAAAAAAAAAHQNMATHGQGMSRGTGGTLPPMPGMPPLYMDPVNTLPAEGGDQRIDRSHPHLMDARSQDMMMMRDFSGRGIKRNPYEMASAHAAATGAGLPMKYHMQMPGLDLSAQPPTKKKRSHKKKPADMPRRPLSAYNLFFSEERERILKEIDGGDKEKEEGEASAKKEEGSAVNEENEEKSPETEGGEEASKPKALLRPLIPNQKQRRPHRRTHGKISFQQLARMVGERWKALPDDRRKYYQELAQEDMKRQKAAMEEYYAKQQAIKDGQKSHQLPGSLATVNPHVQPQQQQQQQQRQSQPPMEQAHVTEGISDGHTPSHSNV